MDIVLLVLVTKTYYTLEKRVISIKIYNEPQQQHLYREKKITFVHVF